MSDLPDNFGFLDGYDARLARIARQAEGYVHTDPESCLFKLRLLVETMAQMMVRTSLPNLASQDLGAMLSALERSQVLDRRQADSMHAIRRDGNAAVHGIAAPTTTAMRRLKDAHGLSQWFVQLLRRGARVARQPFVMPSAPSPEQEAQQREADALEDRIDSQRQRTRDALLLFRDQGEIDLWVPRLRAELQAFADVAAVAGETAIEAETMEIMMMLELEQLLEHPVMGPAARTQQRVATSAITGVRQALDAREADYARERERIAQALDHREPHP